MLNQYQDVFRCFQQNDVRYVIIGGIAAILHGVPRATFDLDLLIDPSPENAERLLRALRQARLATAVMTTADRLLDNEITVFNDRLRIDVQTRTPGLDFETAWQNRVVIEHHGQPFFVASRDDLIAAKKAAGREIDLADVESLEAEPPVNE